MLKIETRRSLLLEEGIETGRALLRGEGIETGKALLRGRAESLGFLWVGGTSLSRYVENQVR